MSGHFATTLNLAMVVEHHARVRPDDVAVVCGDVRMTYAGLNTAANRAANALRSIGIAPGDHVALACPNIPHFPVAYYGILKTGAVAVPLNVLFRSREVAFHLKDSDAKAVLCFEGTEDLPLAAVVKKGFDEVAACEKFVTIELDPASHTPIEGAISFAEITRNQPLTFHTHPSNPDDTAVIFYTSGTTGLPKGAELTHLNLVMNAMISRDLVLSVADMSLGGTNVTLCTLPLFHSTAQNGQMNANFYGGQSIVLLPRFEPQAMVDAILKEKVNFWTGVPTMFWMLLNHVRKNNIDTAPLRENLKLLFSGGAPMPVELMREFAEVFGVRVLEGYGLSETSPVAMFNHAEKRSKPGTVGQPLMMTEVACFDDDDKPVADGQAGEVVVRGHNVMKGYYNNPKATAEAMRGGWFHTGDIGVFDEDGYLSIVDRKKDMILRGGYNVYPRELEEVIMTHPAVSLVAVIGIPHEKYGEEVKAFIILKPEARVTETEMLDWCRERISANKYPRLIEFCESMPMSASGKVLKRELRALNVKTV